MCMEHETNKLIPDWFVADKSYCDRKNGRYVIAVNVSELDINDKVLLAHEVTKQIIDNKLALHDGGYELHKIFGIHESVVGKRYIIKIDAHIDALGNINVEYITDNGVLVASQHFEQSNDIGCMIVNIMRHIDSMHS